MCGIAGIINLNGSDTEQVAALRLMVCRMKNRGPDDEGYVLCPREGCTSSYFGTDTVVPRNGSTDKISGFPDRHIDRAGHQHSLAALGHRRLSIVDLSSKAHQPMATSDLRYWIVYNGEVYNFREIALELLSMGVTLQSSSDTEVVLQAFVKWGHACLERFNGMFAFAIWDNQKKTLFCARDRIGIKPFYYTVCNNQFVFASDIKTIISSGLYSPVPDVCGLYLAMAFGIAPRPTTAFKSVYALEQGHWMIVDALSGKISKKRYWSIPIGTQIQNMSEMDARDLLEEHLTSAIRYRLEADVPVGTFMSGGIDSTTISAIASKLHPGIKAFTLGYESNAPEFDEVSQARATAAMHSMEHIVHIVKPEETLCYLAEWVDGYEEPFYHLAANYVISQIVKNNEVTVVLNGLGGDELFAGYPYYRYALKFSLLRKISPFIQIIKNLPCVHPGIQRVLRLLQATSPDRLHTGIFMKWPETELQKLFAVSELKGFDTIEFIHNLYVAGCHLGDDSVEAFSYMDLMNYIGNHHVHRVDQFTMAHSIEGRFPFLDHNLVEAAFKIPSRHKLHGKTQKYVLRKVAEKYIAPECLGMQKKGFGLPLKQWLDGPLRNFVENKLFLLERREMFNDRYIRHNRLKFKAGNYHYTRIWHLVMLELWYETFIEGMSREVIYDNFG